MLLLKLKTHPHFIYQRGQFSICITKCYRQDIRESGRDVPISPTRPIKCRQGKVVETHIYTEDR